MLKQKARAIAIGVLLTDLALTALSLPIAWALRQGPLRTALPGFFPLAIYPLEQYLLLLFFILPIWGLLLSAAGFYRSHRTLPFGEEIWAAARVSVGGAETAASADEADARRVVERYPSGAEVDVWFDPRDPRRSVLVRGAATAPLVAVVAIGLALAGAGLFALAR